MTKHEELERDLRSQSGPREVGYAPSPLPMIPDDVVSASTRSSRLPRAIMVAGAAVAGALAIVLLAGILSSPGPEVGSSGSASPSPEPSTSPMASVPGDYNTYAPLPSDEGNARSFTPMIESPEIGVDYHVYLSLHCGYSNVQQVGFGGRQWRFTENGTADSMYVEGTLRLVSADAATLTVDVALVTGVLIADGTAHPLVPVTEEGGPICI